jgi:hypothetical protein
MQPLGFATNPETGFVQVFDRCFGHCVAHGVGEILEPCRGLLADPRDGCGGHAHPEQIGHQRLQTFLWQQLVMQKIQHKGASSSAILNRCCDVVWESRSCRFTAPATKASVGTVFGDDHGLGFGQVEYLPSGETVRLRLIQCPAAAVTGLGKVVDDDIRLVCAAEGFAGMAFLAAGTNVDKMQKPGIGTADCRCPLLMRLKGKRSS